MAIETNLYHYRAIVQSVYDGDTCTVDLDLGLSTWIRGENLRLSRIDAPEVRGEERKDGLRSRDFLSSVIEGKSIVVQTIKDRREKYGRYLAEIWVTDINGEWININDLMVQKGYAEYAEY